MFRIVAAALVLMLGGDPAGSAEGKRVALVIGMGEYQHLSSLPNPVPDAKAIAAELKSHGFEVSEHYNLDRADLLDALEKFKREAAGADVALVYYAGHGMEIEGKNVLAPTDMEVECENKTRAPLGRPDQLFKAAGPAPQQIVLLDACRNDPFPQCPTRGAGPGSGFRGLSLLGEADRTLLIANATGCPASSRPTVTPAPIRPSPALCSKISTRTRTSISATCSNKTAADVKIASRGAQVPEVTTQGGSPHVCLDASGLWRGGPSSAAEAG